MRTLLPNAICFLSAEVTKGHYDKIIKSSWAVSLLGRFTLYICYQGWKRSEIHIFRNATKNVSDRNLPFGTPALVTSVIRPGFEMWLESHIFAWQWKLHFWNYFFVTLYGSLKINELQKVFKALPIDNFVPLFCRT